MHPALCKDKINYTVLPVQQDVLKKKIHPSFILHDLSSYLFIWPQWFNFFLKTS